ncbi:peptidase S8 and S53 subtilisin kexin sedolisin [Clostridium sp. DL-VIII]|uniref:S8 family peptidase n=1 Tax=Clostridium sp. DL-VIII TaxID=641107 RepID=UPI00023AFB4F|nr:S8 family peptidase [Clostridium sp. DL-VIII]EHJ00116.1 peptidase S8 and S53 subtilisin kexin sedolisin [Clostridium sp. DL-VIII]
MPYSKNCNLYYTDSPNYLVEYRGNFKEEIDKVSYACGDIITNTIGIVSTSPENIDRLKKDVPAIMYIDFRRRFVLQDISPSSVDNINAIKINPYLNLDGRGVLIGMVDTGIDYLNEEFIREDDTSRIVSIWDQSIQDTTDKSVYVGRTFSNEEINNAIKAYRNKQDPYAIVPSKDDNGHGTQIAGIIGAKGFNSGLQGIATGCDFVIVKLLESSNFVNELKANGVPYTPVYNTSEVLAAVEYLKNYALTSNRPMVLYLGVGTTDGNHDGNNLISRHLASVASNIGITIVAGVGNEGASDGHASGNIQQVGNIASVELRIPREMKVFSLSILVLKPNTASLNVISPNGEASNFIKAKSSGIDNINFVFFRTQMTVGYFNPEQFTGHEVITVSFKDIKAGIWTFQLRGEYITDGRYHIWLPPQKTLPENTRFLQSDPFTTLTIPATADSVITVAYHGNDNALVAASGKGYNVNVNINPDIATLGVNILTTKPNGGTTTVSGSSAATGIIAGACALILQWGVVNGNDKTMFSTKVLSYLILGADRSNPSYRYPNREIGYGFFDLLGTFNIISRSFRIDINPDIDDNSIEYFVKKLFIRIPKFKVE